VEKNCKTCGKPLPLGYDGEQCSLCKVGLAPVRMVETMRSAQEYEGRILSGMFCPGCSAELSVADLTLGRCAICNSIINANTAISTPFQPVADDLPGSLRHTNQVGQKVWPDDAPLW
jgi:hypothetical protein